MNSEIRNDIIRSALQSVDLWHDNAEVLVYGTGEIESGFDNLKQIGGPALGYFQMEPATHEFLKEYLDQPRNLKLKVNILSACEMQTLPSDEQLIYNLRYAAIMCRVRYLNAKPDIPMWYDYKGMAQYYIKYYNRGGRAQERRCTAIFEQIVGDDRFTNGIS